MNFGKSLGRYAAALVVCALAGTGVLGAADGTEQDEIAVLKAVLADQQKQLQALQQMLERQQVLLERVASGVPVSRGAIGEVASIRPVLPAAPVPALAIPSPQAIASATGPATPKTDAPPPPLKWFEKFSLRGYTQIRYNRLLETNDKLVCAQCDASLGNNNGFFIRRARFVLSGDINSHIALYAQPDFASTSGNLNFGQLRDLYFDISFDKKKEYRVRLGQSKVPYSFENLQSSQNRLALDRADGTNSAFPNERDLGAFFYYAPEKIRKRFADLVSSGLKGTGDYGVVGVGTFNGQGLNRAEANNNLHYIARVSYPFQMKNGRFIEPGIAAYTGATTITSDIRGAGVRGLDTFADKRVNGSITIYPQPLGFQAEYNVGKGPQYNPRNNTIETRRLFGGYAQAMYMKKYQGQVFTPFVKFQYYNGGKRFELDARRYLVRDLEFGLEWQKNAYFELVGEYVKADRTYEDSRSPNNRQKGNLLRLQVQINY